MVETVKYASVSIEDVFASRLRLEANVFNVEARKAKDVLRNCKWEILHLKDFMTDCFYGGRAKRNYISKFAKGAVGFIGSAEMLEVNPQPVKFLSSVLMDIKPFRVHECMILISRSGTIGNVTLVNKTLTKHLVSEHAIRIVPKEYAGYVYAYLKSSVGKTIVMSNSYGAVVLQIEPEHLENIIIPNPDKKLKEKIHNLVFQSFDLRDKANEMIEQAEKLLIKELQLPPIEQLQPDYYAKQTEVKTFSVRLDTLNNRFDGSYHNPIVASVLDCLFDAGATIKRLDDKEVSEKIIQAGRFKRNYVESSSDNGIVFLGGKQLLELDPSNKKYLSLTTHSNRVAKELFVHENMIAVTCSGTIGKVNLIPKHWENWTMSQHVMRIVPKSKDNAGYLYIWLQSDYGKALIKRLTYGSVVDEIEEEHLAEVPIPILKNKTAMQKINDLALQANNLRAQAYYKEQEAIKIMNDEVIYATA